MKTKSTCLILLAISTMAIAGLAQSIFQNGSHGLVAHRCGDAAVQQHRPTKCSGAQHRPTEPGNRVRKTMKTSQTIVALLLCLASAGSARASDFDGSKPLRCSPIRIVV